MAELFDRRAVLQMDTIRVDGLRVAFKVERTAKPEPNSAEVSAWNLSRDTRSKMADRSVPVVVQAGYGDDTEQLFAGDIKPEGVSTVRDGPDWVTTFKAGDGFKAFTTKRFHESFAKGVKTSDVLKKLVKQLGVGLGNALDKIKEGGSAGEALDEFVGGAVVEGAVHPELTRLLAAQGLDWSIQDGRLQVLEVGGHTDEEAVLLNPATGLIGSPEPGADGFTKFRSLLRPRLAPGRRAKLETANYNGFYVVSKVVHSGDTHGADWYSDCEGKPL